MPGRKVKPPRLWLRPDERTWIILHRGRQIRTGCGADQAEAASQALGAYIGTQHRSTVGRRDPDDLAIADTLTPEQWQDVQHYNELLGRLANINEFFGDKAVAALKAQLCRDYADHLVAGTRKAGVGPCSRSFR